MRQELERMAALKGEISVLKKQRKEQAIVAKRERRWVNATKALPATCRVLAWANDQVERCWYADGKFYVYDGSWMYTDKDILDSVTHWMPRDWIVSREWPPYGPGLKNRIVYLWYRLTDGAQSMANDLRPKGWSTTAQLSRKPTFFVNRSTGEVMTGGPEHVHAPRGYDRVVCNRVYEAEQWSERQRQWDRSKHSRLQEHRASVEEPIHAEIRSEMHNRMANARNATNREFMRRAIEMSDRKQSPWKYERESYMHSEGFENKN